MARVFVSKTKGRQIAEMFFVDFEQKPFRNFGRFGFSNPNDFVYRMLGGFDLAVVPSFNVFESCLFRRSYSP